MLPSCEANGPERTEMVTWLGSQSSLQNLLLLWWWKDKEQPPVPGAPMASPGSTDIRMTGRAGTAGLACLIFRTSSRAGILFGKGWRYSLHRGLSLQVTPRENKHREKQQDWDTQGQTEGPEAEEGKEEALISSSFTATLISSFPSSLCPVTANSATSDRGGKQGLPTSSLLSINTFLKWITASPSPAASLKEDPGLIHLHAARFFSWPWRGTHLLLALVLLLAICTRNVLFLALLTHA